MSSSKMIVKAALIATCLTVSISTNNVSAARWSSRETAARMAPQRAELWRKYSLRSWELYKAMGTELARKLARPSLV